MCVILVLAGVDFVLIYFYKVQFYSFFFLLVFSVFLCLCFLFPAFLEHVSEFHFDLSIMFLSVFLCMISLPKLLFGYRRFCLYHRPLGSNPYKKHFCVLIEHRSCISRVIFSSMELRHPFPNDPQVEVYPPRESHPRSVWLPVSPLH